MSVFLASNEIEFTERTESEEKRRVRRRTWRDCRRQQNATPLSAYRSQRRSAFYRCIVRDSDNVKVRADSAGTSTCLLPVMRPPMNPAAAPIPAPIAAPLTPPAKPPISAPPAAPPPVVAAVRFPLPSPSDSTPTFEED